MPATQLHLTRWVDPAIKATEFSDPIDVIWLAILGPSAFVLLVFLRKLVDDDPWERSVDLDWFSQKLGLGTCDSKHAPIFRAIARLVQFGLAKRMARGQLAVRCQVPPPTPQQLGVLSLGLQADYRESGEREAAGPAGP